jgi:hypothetical protein
MLWKAPTIALDDQARDAVVTDLCFYLVRFNFWLALKLLLLISFFCNFSAKFYLLLLIFCFLLFVYSFLWHMLWKAETLALEDQAAGATETELCFYLGCF